MLPSTTFTSFCEAQAEQQRRAGFKVPSSESPDFSYFQWLEVARDAYEERGPKMPRNEEPALKAAKADLSGAALPVEPLPTGNALADAIAQQLVRSLEGQTSPHGWVSQDVREAAKEPFPLPPFGPAALRDFMLSTEVTMRLSLWYPRDGPLAYAADCLRVSLHPTIVERQLTYQEGSFPSVRCLVELQMLRHYCSRWQGFSPKMRRAIADLAISVSDRLRCPAFDQLRAVAVKLDASAESLSLSPDEIGDLVAQMSAAVPFEVPACRERINLYPAPRGKLKLDDVMPPKDVTAVKSPPPAAPPAAAAATPKAGGGERGRKEPVEPSPSSFEEDVLLGDLIRKPTAATPAPQAAKETAVAKQEQRQGQEQKQEQKQKKEQQEREQQQQQQQSPVLVRGRAQKATRPAAEVVAPPSTGAAAPTTATTAATTATAGTGRIPTATVNGHPACVSRYHRRYADPSRHASAECHYCATCHLMEILFRADTRDCVWKHWPTERKISFHLRRFPEVKRLALCRLKELERGVQLAVTDAVPL